MLRKSRLRPVTIRRPRTGCGGNAFEAEGQAAQADVQPMSGTAAAQMYGLRPSEMRQLLAAEGCELLPGYGVCVDVAADAEPDFRVVYVAEWARHVLAHLRYIPEAERGADE